MSDSIQICCNCEGIMKPNLFHNCIKGITENINRLHENLNTLLVKKIHPHEDLKLALQIIEEVKNKYEALGYYPYPDYQDDPFHDICNAIRMRLGMKLISRK